MITIIVLLILAGITIAMLSGQNGILTNAQSANMQSDYFQAEERVRLAYMAVKTEIMTQKATNSSYNAQKVADAKKLRDMVANELTGNGTWEVGPTDGEITGPEVAAITIRYSKASLKEGGISTTPKRPKQDGYVDYEIKLKPQDATLTMDGEPVGGSSNPGGENTGGINYSDDVKTKLAVNVDSGTSPWVQYNEKKYKVLYNDSNGIEIIAMELTDNYTYGYNDESLPTSAEGYTFTGTNANFEKARWSYNNLVQNLNKKAEDTYINNTVIDDARCVGSKPGRTNKNTRNSTPISSPSYLLGKGLEQGEELGHINQGNIVVDSGTPNYTSDFNRMTDLGVLLENNYYLLASRVSCVNSDAVNLYVRFVYAGALYGDLLCYMSSGGVAGCHNQEVEIPFRPVLHLASGVSIASGEGTEALPFVLK